MNTYDDLLATLGGPINEPTKPVQVIEAPKEEKDILTIYNELTDNNLHGEAALLLVKKFGTKEEIVRIQTINAYHLRRGHILPGESRERDEISNKYWKKLKEKPEPEATTTTQEGKIKLKYLTIHWAEGDNSRFDKFPKTYNSWEEANKAALPIYYDIVEGGRVGYNKVKFSLLFEDGQEYNDGRLDICEKEDNPQEGNVFGRHIFDYQSYHLKHKVPYVTDKHREEIKEFLVKYDFGFTSKVTTIESTPEPEDRKAKPDRISHNNSLNIVRVNYSEKSFAIFGDTKPIKEQLKDLGGKFNAFLTHPITGEKRAGWIFSKKQEEAIKKAFGL